MKTIAHFSDFLELRHSDLICFGYWVYLSTHLVNSQKSLTLLDCKSEILFIYICMAFHFNLETDYYPVHLNS